MKRSLYLGLILSLLSFVFGAPVFAQSLNTSELSLMNSINRYRLNHKLSPLKVDPLASRVAREHSQNMKSDDFFSLVHPEKGSLTHQLAFQRMTGRVVNSIIASDQSIPLLFQQLQGKNALLDPDITHMGVGVVQESESHFYPERLWLTLVFTQHMAQISAPPKTLPVGQTIQISGSLVSGFSHPRLPVTFPNGQVAIYPNKKNSHTEFLFQVPTHLGKGKYTLELLVKSPGQGPKVASILPVYVGEEFPLTEPENETKPRHFENTNQAALHMLKLINEARQDHQKSTLARDPLLDYVAYLHSEDMAKRQFFAHVNPDGENPNARFRKNGGFGWVGENIVLDARVDNAFSELMKSPGHRDNILKSDFTHVGLGLYYHNSKYYITQLFQKKQPKADVRAVKKEIFDWMRQTRSNKGLPMFVTDMALYKTAYIHSKSMAKTQTLSYHSGGMSFTRRYVKSKGRLPELKTIILMADSSDKIKADLEKHREIFAQSAWTHWGYGVYQGHHKKYGENMIWLTIGLGKS